MCNLEGETRCRVSGVGVLLRGELLIGDRPLSSDIARLSGCTKAGSRRLFDLDHDGSAASSVCASTTSGNSGVGEKPSRAAQARRRRPRHDARLIKLGQRSAARSSKLLAFCSRAMAMAEEGLLGGPVFAARASIESRRGYGVATVGPMSPVWPTSAALVDPFQGFFLCLCGLNFRYKPLKQWNKQLVLIPISCQRFCKRRNAGTHGA